MVIIMFSALYTSYLSLNNIMFSTETDLPSPVESELRGWRYWIRPLVALIYAAVLLVALPLLSVDLYENSVSCAITISL